VAAIRSIILTACDYEQPAAIVDLLWDNLREKANVKSGGV
jgi:hypothetical protein